MKSKHTGRRKPAQKRGRVEALVAEQLPRYGTRATQIDAIPSGSRASLLARSPAKGAIQTQSRDSCEARYRGVFEERLYLRPYVTYALNKKHPVYNWFKYKEAFSRELVAVILDEFGVRQEDLIFDPFAGCGTTLLACKEMRYGAVGVDILPIAVFVARVKLRDWNNIDELIKATDELMQKSLSNAALAAAKAATSLPDIPIIHKAFSPRTKDEIVFYKNAILGCPRSVRDFLMLGLLSILEDVSYTSKDGQFLRLVHKEVPPVKEALRRKLMQMISDLCQYQGTLFGKGTGEAEIFLADARAESLPPRYREKIGAVITSPPYLNRYDYSRTYALELCTLLVENCEQMRNVRHSLLRSHIESREESGKEISIDALEEILSNLSRKPLNNPRIPIMIKAYFEDMNQVIRHLFQYLKPGGLVALVVANARFEGEQVPTDLILCEIAETHGFETEKIWITRYKGNSSQQMARYGRLPVRESVVFWRKPA
jgi:DNA modification methylase